jgi:hypothetical protein
VFAGVLAAACGGSDDHPSDVRYRIEIAHVGQIVDDEGPGGSSGGQAHLTRLDDGRILFWDHYRAWQIRVYDSNGAFLSRFGRLGDGPGEFRRARLHGQIADTIFVMDDYTGRLSLFSAEEFEHLDTRLSGAGNPARIVFSPDGFMVANSLDLSEEGIALPLREVDTRGQVKGAFGSEFPVLLAVHPPLHWRDLSLEKDGTLWVLPLFEPRLERWHRTRGPPPRWQMDTSFVIHSADLPDPRDYVGAARSVETPPTPYFMALARENEGPIWINLLVPHTGWQDRLYESSMALNAEWYSPGRTQRVTRLMAVDPNSGEILATRELDEHWMQFIGDSPIVYSWDLGDDFVPYIDLWRPKLVVDKGGL